jgi:5-methyltetrahydrofolate--homocysteine methyltransferase
VSELLAALRERVHLCDGGFGARIQGMTLDVARDFGGLENCTEILNATRPDIVRDIHEGYLEAGSDIVQTNTFGGSPLTLAEFGISDRAHELNKRAGELARESLERFKGDGRKRFVLGSIGPGTRLPSLGHVPYDTIEAALATQAGGLIDGAVDGILIETCQDPLQIKAAINGAKIAREARKTSIPILVQVTVETTGTLLVGTDIAAAATIVEALGVSSLGLNCATGPQEMAVHVKWLAENWPGLISVQPNAGLPELVDGKTHYPLGAQEIARWLERFVIEDGLNLIGGCCGTNTSHIQALDAMLRNLAKGGRRPTPVKRLVRWTPGLASLFAAVPYAQENAFFSIGERCNANGSKKFRDAQAAEDWDACVALAREQIKEGSHALDVCTAFVGRNEVADMTEVVTRLHGASTAPLVIDSTELPVLEAALKLYGGKAVVNSINFESGEPPAEARMALVRKFGAGVVALTIDEAGMAKDVECKVKIAKRLHDFACGRYGLASADLMIDPLTFTICTGNEDDRKLALWTLEAIERIRAELPDVQIVLGLSNVSFGLNPAARHVLNSVFLDHAIRRGMTGAIVHLSKIMPLHKIPAKEVEVAEDLIFDRRRPGYDPLHAFIALFENRKATKTERPKAASIEEALKHRIVDGDRKGLEDDLAAALGRYKPLAIINDILLDGMKVVGELFGAGKMQLPFVLQSAETMKAAVRYLEPLMERVDGQQKGTIVLATVKGDVHDIGKNLVDIILTNNGYRVVNLGIKQPIESILQAAKDHRAHAIGMSGLLVKSTVIMRENMEVMTREGFDVPVLLGGAALTRKYVEEDCRQAYACGRVAYARDAFDGLALMDKIAANDFDFHVAKTGENRRQRPSNTRRQLGRASDAALRPVDAEETRLRREELARGVAVPTPPFWGARVIECVPVEAIVPYLSETMLFQFQWGFRKAGKSIEEFREWAKLELRPVLKRMLDLCKSDDILRPQAIYGYWKAAGEGNDLVLFETDGRTEVARFTLPRQPKAGGLSIADFVRDISQAERDVVGLQIVTVGQKASDVARQWFSSDRYQDYLYLHGLSVEMAEALAEHTHKRIRAELGFGHEDDRDIAKMLKQGYRGSRYSFGYPACPNLADQRHLLRLLGAERIGVSLTEEDMLDPEQSTSAIVCHHPQAKYFSL